MARKRMVSGVTDWDGADGLLRDIDALNREIEAEEAELDRAVNAAKGKAKTAIKKIEIRKKLLELQLQTFCQSRQEDFLDKRSKEITFGFVGWRYSSKVIVPRKKEAALAVVEKLKDLGQRQCIQTKETPIKDEIKKLDADTLAALAPLGVRREGGDTFWYEAKRAKVLAAEAA